MIKIEEGREFILSNVLSYRGFMFQNEITERIKKIAEIAEASNVKRMGSLISTTYGIDDKGCMDMELLIPIDRVIDFGPEYQVKTEFKLFNAVYSKHIGSMESLSDTYEELYVYIKNNGLHQITTAYSINDNSDISRTAVDIYIGVSSNKL